MVFQWVSDMRRRVGCGVSDFGQGYDRDVSSYCIARHDLRRACRNPAYRNRPLVAACGARGCGVTSIIF